MASQREADQRQRHLQQPHNRQHQLSPPADMPTPFPERLDPPRSSDQCRQVLTDPDRNSTASATRPGRSNIGTPTEQNLVRRASHARAVRS